LPFHAAGSGIAISKPTLGETRPRRRHCCGFASVQVYATSVGASISPEKSWLESAAQPASGVPEIVGLAADAFGM